MYIPIHRWEFRVAAEIIRENLRIDQSGRKIGWNLIHSVDELTRGVAWRIAESLSGSKLPR